MNRNKWNTAFLKQYLEGEVTIQGDCGQVTFTPDGDMTLSGGYEHSLFATDEGYNTAIRAIFIMGHPMELILNIVDGVLTGDKVAMRAKDGFIKQHKVQFMIDTYKANFELEVIAA